eukprot:9495723-Pyramimonas_sp.AAC.2
MARRGVTGAQMWKSNPTLAPLSAEGRGPRAQSGRVWRAHSPPSLAAEGSFGHITAMAPLTMMRGGTFLTEPETGAEVFVTNDAPDDDDDSVRARAPLQLLKYERAAVAQCLKRWLKRCLKRGVSLK